MSTCMLFSCTKFEFRILWKQLRCFQFRQQQLCCHTHIRLFDSSLQCIHKWMITHRNDHWNEPMELVKQSFRHTVYTQSFHKNEYALNTTTDGNIGVLWKIVTLKTHNDQLKSATRNHKIDVVLSNPIRPTEDGWRTRIDDDCASCQVRQYNNL